MSENINIVYSKSGESFSPFNNCVVSKDEYLFIEDLDKNTLMIPFKEVKSFVNGVKRYHLPFEVKDYIDDIFS